MTTSLIKNQEDFEELLFGDHENANLISDTITDTGRWMEYHEVIWSEYHGDTTAFFSFTYEAPLTELQEGSETENDFDQIQEVWPQEVTVTHYLTKAQIDKRAAEDKALAEQ